MTDGSDGNDERPGETAGPESDDSGSAPDTDTSESDDSFSQVPDDERTNGSGAADFRRIDGQERGEPEHTDANAGGGVPDPEPGGGDASPDAPVDDAHTVGDRGGYDRPGRDDGPAAGPERDAAGVAEERLPDGVRDERDGQTDESPADDGDRQTGLGGEHDPDPAPDAPLAEDVLVDKGPRKVSGDAPPGAEPAGAGTGTGGTGVADGVTDDDGGLFGEGPESDEEMPLTEHIEEMMRRLGAVFAVGGAVTLAVLVAGNVTSSVPNAETIITFLWDSHVGFDNYRPYVYGPLELLLTKLKVAGLAGVVTALPVFVYQTYRFMRPGLYPHERRYYLAAVPTSLVLALVGVAFAHFVVLPAIFQYFIGYTEASAQLAFGLRETFNLILLLMGYMAVVFQIPLFIQLATMMGVVSREWLEQRRLLFWGSFLGLSFVVSPDPTGMSPIIVAATMVVLFEGTLALLRWTGN